MKPSDAIIFVVNNAVALIPVQVHFFTKRHSTYVSRLPRWIKRCCAHLSHRQIIQRQTAMLRWAFSAPLSHFYSFIYLFTRLFFSLKKKYMAK